MFRKVFYSQVILLGIFLFSGCNNQSKYHEEASKGFTSEELAEDFERIPPKEVTVTIENGTFNPEEIEAKPGQLLKLTFENKDDEAHNLAFKLTAGEVKFESAVPAGNTKEMEFTVPVVYGAYAFYDPLVKDAANAPQGKLKVVESEENE